MTKESETITQLRAALKQIAECGIESFAINDVKTPNININVEGNERFCHEPEVFEIINIARKALRENK